MMKLGSRIKKEAPDREWRERCAEMRPKILERLRTETIETLTKHGRGVGIGQMCIYLGITATGTSREKAERLLKWRDEQH